MVGPCFSVVDIIAHQDEPPFKPILQIPNDDLFLVRNAQALIVPILPRKADIGRHPPDPVFRRQAVYTLPDISLPGHLSPFFRGYGRMQQPQYRKSLLPADFRYNTEKKLMTSYVP